MGLKHLTFLLEYTFVKKINMLTKTQINKGNELIAKFMGFKIAFHKNSQCKENPKGLEISSWKTIKDVEGKIQGFTHIDGLEFYSKQSNGGRQGSWANYLDMPFDSSWDWIMRVIEKIELIGETDKKYGTFCEISTPWIRIGTITKDHKLNHYSKKLEGVYIALLEFLKKHNKQK